MPLARILLLTTLLAGTAAWAQTPDLVMLESTAGADDAAVHPSRLRVLSPAEHDLFTRAFAAATHGDWVAARGLANQAGNSPMAVLARRLLEWRYALDKNSSANFAEIDAVIRDTDAKGWPLRGTLQARAEAAMPVPPDPNAMTPVAIVAWFGARTPNSSLGNIRLGEALVATGQAARGAKLIRDGWTAGSFDTPVELDIVQHDGQYLTPQSDRDRLDALLWRGEIGAAQRELSRVDGSAARVGAARIALVSGLKYAGKALAAAADSNDPGLLFDWSRALRKDGRDGEAHAVLLRVPAAVMVSDHAARWWPEVNLQARDALKSGDPRTALALVRHAGFADGASYAEQEFLAGFIALRFLKTPDAALVHFRRLDAGVARPISKSRAQYWIGRSLETQGATADALTHYRAAAAFPETFYGQVALARLDPAPMLHLTDTAVEASAESDIAADPLMDAIKVLADLGQSVTLRAFIDRDMEVYPSPRHAKRLMMLLVNWGYPEIALRLGKTASYAGANMFAFTHPVIALPAYPGPGTAPDPALVLGLIRQETEFDAYAISGAGARGLMQMMPASAKLAARQAGLPYRPEALLNDTRYNMQLGMTEYRGHMDRYGGSYVLAAASYNAGPANAAKWIAAYGDPRTNTDPIDWIEQIPFSETRNYVQRVLENTQVYRARLAGRDVRLRILDDLYAPGAPRMGVLGR